MVITPADATATINGEDHLVRTYGHVDTDGLALVAIHRQHCITDLGKGFVEVRIDQGASTHVRQVPGFFPAMPE